MSVVDNASGQDAQATEENKIKVARQVIEAFNTGDQKNVSQFMSPEYLNHNRRWIQLEDSLEDLRSL